MCLWYHIYHKPADHQWMYPGRDIQVYLRQANHEEPPPDINCQCDVRLIGKPLPGAWVSVWRVSRPLCTLAMILTNMVAAILLMWSYHLATRASSLEMSQQCFWTPSLCGWQWIQNWTHWWLAWYVPSSWTSNHLPVFSTPEDHTLYIGHNILEPEGKIIWCPVDCGQPF